jgi:hypothetical protein
MTGWIILRHARACRGHPRLLGVARRKTWMAGTSPAMTAEKHCAPDRDCWDKLGDDGGVLHAQALSFAPQQRCPLRQKRISKICRVIHIALQSGDAESDNRIERRASRPLEMAEPAGSVDVIFGNTPSLTKPHVAPIARVRLAQAHYLVRAHRHDRVVDCRGPLFCVAQRRHPADR